MTALPVVRPAPLKPSRAPATAIAALTAAGGCLARLESSVLGVLQAAVAGLLVWMAAIDLEFHLLPDRLMLPATATVLTVLAFVDRTSPYRTALWRWVRRPCSSSQLWPGPAI